MLKKLVLFKLLKNHFGFKDALVITRALLSKKSVIKLPSKKIEICLRPNTKDLETFEEVFISNIYDINLPFNPVNIVDAGANVGLASLFFKLKYPNSKIVAIEIESKNIEMILKNTKSFNDITVLERGLYNKNTFFKITDPYNATNSFQIEEVSGNQDYDIQSITLDEILVTNDWKTIDILKIDIEGAEKQLFEENYQNWLPKVKVLMIETHDRMISKCSYTVMKTINEYNFILYTTTEGTLIYFNLSLISIN